MKIICYNIVECGGTYIIAKMKNPVFQNKKYKKNANHIYNKEI